MANWIETLGDAIFQIANYFTATERPRRLLGVFSAAVTAFGAIGTLVAVVSGIKLDPAGYIILIPALLATTAIAAYCLLTDRTR